jgi:SET domain-containing protein
MILKGTIIIIMLILILLISIINFVYFINKNKYTLNGNYINKSNVGGRGVFAGKDYNIGEIIEISPCIKDKLVAFNRGILKDYIFRYDENHHILSLGYGSMYSHNDNPNTQYKIITNNNDISMLYIAIKPIKKDEEIFINYGESWWDSRRDRLNKI